MNKTITVKGIGKASVRPDLIIISLVLKAKDMDYERTMEMAAVSLDKLRAALSGIGFKRADLKTSNFSVQTAYESQRNSNGGYTRRFDGYVCQHDLKLEFDLDMDRLSRTLSTLARSLSEPELSIRFSVKDRDAVSAALLQDAAKNAKAKAEVLAAAAGVKLGELITIDYNWGELQLFSPTQYEMEERCCLEAQAGNSIEIEPDDIKASDTVTFVWGIF